MLLTDANKLESFSAASFGMSKQSDAVATAGVSSVRVCTKWVECAVSVVIAAVLCRRHEHVCVFRRACYRSMKVVVSSCVPVTE